MFFPERRHRCFDDAFWINFTPAGKNKLARNKKTFVKHGETRHILVSHKYHRCSVDDSQLNFSQVYKKKRDTRKFSFAPLNFFDFLPQLINVLDRITPISKH